MSKSNNVQSKSRRNFFKFVGATAGVAAISATGATSWASNSISNRASRIENETPPYPLNPSRLSPKSYSHKSDFSVMTVGTGSPTSVIGRSGPCTLVQYKGKYFLVDLGAGTTFRIVESGIPLGAIDNIFITHMHTDHTDDYCKFMIESWTMGRRETEIYGTNGVKALHNVFRTVFPEDIEYRLGKTKTMEGMYENVHITELAGNNSFTVDGVTVSTAPTIHSIYNLAYRFDVAGKSIVVSGDTSYSESLINLAENADILVIDSGRVINDGYIGLGERIIPSKKRSGPQGPTDPESYIPVEEAGRNHASLEDVAIMASKARVKKLVLTHYPPEKVNEQATRDRYKLFYDGELIFGRDLLEITP